LHLILLPLAWHFTEIGSWERTGFFLLIASGCIFEVIFQLLDLPTALEKRAVGLLAEIGDKNSVGLIVEELYRAITYGKEALMKGLERILPTLNASDETLLSLDHIKILNDCLRIGVAFDSVSPVASARFQIAILKAYEQIGDSHTLEAVRSVAPEHPKNI